jgi:hypothetical protein
MPHSPALACHDCKCPLLLIDASGERLIGCIACNKWRATWDGRRHELSSDDLVALRGIKTGQPESQNQQLRVIA